METAKIDVRKLQLLNDCLTSAQEALNQVRLSVHGLQPGIQGQPFGGQVPFPQSPWFSGQGANGQVAFGGQVPFAGQVPFGQVPFAGQVPFGQTPWQQGISHTSPLSPEMYAGQLPYGYGRVIDPSTLSRVAQTFPFAFSPYPIGV